jgi:hypothetical protein
MQNKLIFREEIPETNSSEYIFEKTIGKGGFGKVYSAVKTSIIN